MKTKLLMLAMLFTATAWAQKSKKQDIASIKEMCGCYEVDFNFAETFSPVKDYEYHDNYRSGALEYVLPISESDEKIVLQHLLVINDTMIIKHWRQDWEYENQDFYTYFKDNTWNYKNKDAKAVKGQWTQKVFQVDDGPRYEGTGSWVHVDGKHYWEAPADAPLPRREYSKRDDYNVMTRVNRQEITDYGWVHDQDNQKVIRENGQDSILVWEKGWNTYTKVDESRCNPAIKWWNEKSVYWSDVRAVWDELYAKKEQLQIKRRVDGKILFMELFALQDELLADANYSSEKAQLAIKQALQPYIESDQRLVSK